jgi:DNA-binding MarR family transcriptional regulator
LTSTYIDVGNPESNTVADIGQKDRLRIAVRIVPLLPAAELLSFLKQMHGPWTEHELAKALNVSSADAKQAVAAMQLQGYVEPVGRSQKWRTSEQGQTVSGAKSPRFTREAVERALSTLSDRIREINRDPSSPYTISEAVAFGDFLSDRARVQAADVGIRVTPKMANLEPPSSATEHKAEEAFLNQLRGKSALVHIESHETWMSARSHLRLL